MEDKNYLNQNLSYTKTTAFGFVIFLCYLLYLKVFIFWSGCLKTKAEWKLTKQQFDNKNVPNIKVIGEPKLKVHFLPWNNSLIFTGTLIKLFFYYLFFNVVVNQNIFQIWEEWEEWLEPEVRTILRSKIWTWSLSRLCPPFGRGGGALQNLMREGA